MTFFAFLLALFVQPSDHDQFLQIGDWRLRAFVNDLNNTTVVLQPPNQGSEVLTLECDKSTADVGDLIAVHYENLDGVGVRSGPSVKGRIAFGNGPLLTVLWAGGHQSLVAFVKPSSLEGLRVGPGVVVTEIPGAEGSIVTHFDAAVEAGEAVKVFLDLCR
jgi:hypothetical protein